MNYIAILDYAHLDNALFLKSFSEALSAQKNTRGIILHGDSLYTQRLVQTGMLSDHARVRSTKDLNHRLVSLLADSGVAAIGLNAYQRDVIRYEEGSLNLNQKFLTGFPENTHLVLSNLVGHTGQDHPVPFDLSELAGILKKKLNLDETFVFSKNETDEIFTEIPNVSLRRFEELDEGFINSTIPDDLFNLPLPCRLITTRAFRDLPETVNSTLIQ